MIEHHRKNAKIAWDKLQANPIAAGIKFYANGSPDITIKLKDKYAEDKQHGGFYVLKDSQAVTKAHNALQKNIKDTEKYRAKQQMSYGFIIEPSMTHCKADDPASLDKTRDVELLLKIRLIKDPEPLKYYVGLCNANGMYQEIEVTKDSKAGEDLYNVLAKMDENGAFSSGNAYAPDKEHYDELSRALDPFFYLNRAALPEETRVYGGAIEDIEDFSFRLTVLEMNKSYNKSSRKSCIQLMKQLQSDFQNDNVPDYHRAVFYNLANIQNCFEKFNKDMELTDNCFKKPIYGNWIRNKKEITGYDALNGPKPNGISACMHFILDDDEREKLIASRFVKPVKPAEKFKYYDQTKNEFVECDKYEWDFSYLGSRAQLGLLNEQLEMIDKAYIKRQQEINDQLDYENQDGAACNRANFAMKMSHLNDEDVELYVGSGNKLGDKKNGKCDVSILINHCTDVTAHP